MDPQPIIDTLKNHGAGQVEVEQLLEFNRNHFRFDSLPDLPLPAAPHVAAWEDYLRQAADRDLFSVLQEALVQLRFPIQKGISQTDDYRGATLRGADPESLATGLPLEHPGELQLRIHPTAAGAVPVLIPSGRNDFKRLVRALAMRNEPLPVPPSMGAAAVSGYNNWDRIRRLRQAFYGQQPHGDWASEFRLRVVPRAELYRDQFLILSDGPYSNVSAAALDLEEAAWRELSVSIRLEHEATHYFTRQVLGSAGNHPTDELLADYAGVVSALGSYRADWALWFLGLEGFPAYRQGGRLQNYLGDPPVSPGSFAVLQPLVYAAVQGLEAFDHQVRADAEPALPDLVLAVAGLRLEELAAPDASRRLLDRYDQLCWR